MVFLFLKKFDFEALHKLSVFSCIFVKYVSLIQLLFSPDIVASAVLSGNRNFEGRVHALTRANYLASPPLVVAYALAGTVSD